MYVYTTAPRRYDYGYMEEHGIFRATDGTEYRVLWANDVERCVSYQLPRYRSGLYYAALERDFIEEGRK